MKIKIEENDIRKAVKKAINEVLNKDSLGSNTGETGYTIGDKISNGLESIGNSIVSGLRKAASTIMPKQNVMAFSSKYANMNLPFYFFLKPGAPCDKHNILFQWKPDLSLDDILANLWPHTGGMHFDASKNMITGMDLVNWGISKYKGYCSTGALLLLSWLRNTPIPLLTLNCSAKYSSKFLPSSYHLIGTVNGNKKPLRFQDGKVYTPQDGDYACYMAGNPGHAAVYLQGKWISDTVQRNGIRAHGNPTEDSIINIYREG